MTESTSRRKRVRAIRGAAPVVPGTNTFTVTATDASGNATTKQYQVSHTGTSRTFTYDPNGNMTSDGTRTFEWDARNQLVAVNVGTHRSEFTYDGKQRRVGRWRPAASRCDDRDPRLAKEP